MDPRVLGAIKANAGLISRPQALDLGMSPGQVRNLVRHRTWVVVRRGIYTTTEIWEGLDDHVGKPLLRARAATLTTRRGWVLSHDSSAHALGIPVLSLADPLVHLTRPGWTDAWTEYGVMHHLAGFREEQVLTVDGLRVLDHARTAVDMAREHGVLVGLVACDAVLRMGVPRAELVHAYEPMANWPGVTSSRTCVDLADPGAETPHESLGRHLVLEAGIGRPETQFPVRTPRGVVWCDIRVGNHVIEPDGRVKYRSVENGGVARDVEQAVWDEKLRHRAITDRRLVVTRLVWEDYWGTRREQAIRRLQADHAESVERFGPELDPELAREAEQLRRQYGTRKPA